MAEPYYSPIENQSPSDEALEHALERVRDDARARAREQRQHHRTEGAAKDSATAAAGGSASTGAGAGARRPQKPADSPRHRRPGDQRTRPIALYALAFVVIAALGFVGIQSIHDTTPAIKGFASAADEQTAAQGDSGSNTAVTSNLTSSVTAALMRTQGWVLPGHVQTVDPALSKIRQQELPDLAPEIAQVPAIQMDIDPAQELAALSAQSEAPELNEELPLPPPPPPVFGTLDGFPDARFTDPATGAPIQGDPFSNREQLALPPLQDGAVNGSGQGNADPLAGVIDSNGAPPLPLDSMLEEINRAAPKAEPDRQATPAPQSQVPPARPSAPARKPAATLSQLQEQTCSRLGFFARISCQDDVRRDFCADRWNRHPDCARTERTWNY